MDYLEAFKNLKTNNKYSRKSPHKAILLLAVIEMYETNMLSENMILYDDNLKRTFQKVWERTLRDDPLFHPDMYLPFWYLQSEDFWHIVPNRGREDILTLLRDEHVKPSEAKLKDCVKYAELDEDLYFLMTLPTGRSSLKRVLLETYFDLTEEQIDRLSESVDNVVDYSVSALSEYVKILSQEKDDVKKEIVATDNELVNQFNNLNEDLQIVLNIQYYSFLKSHRSERDIFKEVCPSVYDLLDKIVNNPLKQGEISPSFAFTYDNFLSDLKISLMSEEGSMELIDKIAFAIEVLRGTKKANNTHIDNIIGNRTDDIGKFPEQKESTAEDSKVVETERDILVDVNTEEKNNTSSLIPITNQLTESPREKTWTANEDELITLCFHKGYSFSAMAGNVRRTELSVKMRLAELGLIGYPNEQDENKIETKTKDESPNVQDYSIENKGNRCYIINNSGECVFSSTGKLKNIGEEVYRICYTYSSISMNKVKIDERDVFVLGNRILYAQHRSPLYAALDEHDYLEQINAVIYNEEYNEYYVQVGSRLYGCAGYYADFGNEEDAVTATKGITDEHKPLKSSKEKRERVQTYLDGDTPAVDNFEDKTQKKISNRYIIRVKYPNGSVFCSNLVWETLVDVVIYAGVERVRQLNILCVGDNLISSRLNDNLIYRSAQKEIGRGLYVCTYSSTDVKYKQIERINQELNLGLKVDKVYVDERSNTQLPKDDKSKSVGIIHNIRNEKAKVDKRIGYIVRLFPSQKKGEIINVRVDVKGIKKLVVKTVNGEVVEIEDLPYLYEVLKRN